MSLLFISSYLFLVTLIFHKLIFLVMELGPRELLANFAQEKDMGSLKSKKRSKGLSKVKHDAPPLPKRKRDIIIEEPILQSIGVMRVWHSFHVRDIGK